MSKKYLLLVATFLCVIFQPIQPNDTVKQVGALTAAIGSGIGVVAGGLWGAAVKKLNNAAKVRSQKRIARLKRLAAWSKAFCISGVTAAIGGGVMMLIGQALAKNKNKKCEQLPSLLCQHVTHAKDKGEGVDVVQGGLVSYDDSTVSQAVKPLVVQDYIRLIRAVHARAEKLPADPFKFRLGKGSRFNRRDMRQRSLDALAEYKHLRSSALLTIKGQTSIDFKHHFYGNADWHCSFHAVAGALTGQEFLGTSFFAWMNHYLKPQKHISKVYRKLLPIYRGWGTISIVDTAQTVANMTGRPVFLWATFNSKIAPAKINQDGDSVILPESGVGFEYPLDHALHLHLCNVRDKNRIRGKDHGKNIVHAEWFDVQAIDSKPYDRAAINKKVLEDRIAVLEQTLDALPPDHWKDVALDIWMHLGVYILSTGTSHNLQFKNQSMAACYQEIVAIDNGCFKAGDELLNRILSIFNKKITTAQQATDLLLIRENKKSRWLELIDQGPVVEDIKAKISSLNPVPLTSRTLSWMDGYALTGKR